MTASSGHWFGSPERPLAGWISRPDGDAGDSGVLVLPPIGYPYWTSHRAHRRLAERLAAAGHTVLRIDYDGTGDSSGDQWEPGRLEAWRRSVVEGAEALRALGCRRLTLVGSRLGGLLALLEGAAAGAEAVVAWAPVVTGRRHAKEIRLLGTAVPEDAARPEGAVVSAGTVYLAETLSDLAALKPESIAARPADRVLLVGASADAALAGHLAALGSAVERRELAGAELVFETPTEYAEVPEDVVEAIAAWVGDATPTQPPAPAVLSARLDWHGAPLAEEVVRFDGGRLTGILTTPESPGGQTVVFLNTGSEPHVGPGRAWVEYARALAATGRRCLRVDFRGWGESADDGHAPGRPYDAHCVDDVLAVVRELRAAGHEHVVLLGLCASAWVALRAILREPVEGVVALNPQLYWQPGDPVEATMAETRLRRTAEREREERGGRRGLWTALDLAGHRPWAGRWLDELRAAGVPVAMLFAAGDDGLEYLDNRLRRRLRRTEASGILTVTEIADVDHSMHRAWLRPRVVAAIAEQLDRWPGAGG